MKLFYTNGYGTKKEFPSFSVPPETDGANDAVRTDNNLSEKPRRETADCGRAQMRANSVGGETPIELQARSLYADPPAQESNSIPCNPNAKGKTVSAQNNSGKDDDAHTFEPDGYATSGSVQNDSGTGSQPAAIRHVRGNTNVTARGEGESPSGSTTFPVTKGESSGALAGDAPKSSANLIGTDVNPGSDGTTPPITSARMSDADQNLSPVPQDGQGPPDSSEEKERNLIESGDEDCVGITNAIAEILRRNRAANE